MNMQIASSELRKLVHYGSREGGRGREGDRSLLSEVMEGTMEEARREERFSSFFFSSFPPSPFAY